MKHTQGTADARMSSKTQSAGGTHQVAQHLETFLMTIDISGPNTNLEWSRLDL